MDIKAIKELSARYSAAELQQEADHLENHGHCSIQTKEDIGELLGDLLQAIEVRVLMDSGLSQQEALREFSKRVRQVLS